MTQLVILVFVFIMDVTCLTKQFSHFAEFWACHSYPKLCIVSANSISIFLKLEHSGIFFQKINVNHTWSSQPCNLEFLDGNLPLRCSYFVFRHFKMAQDTAEYLLFTVQTIFMNTVPRWVWIGKCSSIYAWRLNDTLFDSWKFELLKWNTHHGRR